ncbi:MFS transporter [Porticoccus sp. GXU_MW_L64]
MATSDINSSRSITSFVLLSVIGVCVFILQPGYVQGLVEYLGFSQEEAGYIASIEMFGVAASTVLMVFLSSRFSWRLLTSVFLGVAVAGNLASFSVTDFNTLSVIRFITGMGFGGIISLAFTMMGLTRLADRNFGYVITWVLIYGALGLLVMPTAFRLVGMNGVLLFFALFSACGFFTLKHLPARASEHVDAEQLAGTGFKWPVKGLFLIAILWVFVRFWWLCYCCWAACKVQAICWRRRCSSTPGPLSCPLCWPLYRRLTRPGG